MPPDLPAGLLIGLSVAVLLLLWVLLLRMVGRRLRRARAAAPPPPPPAGDPVLRIPLVAAFAGWRGLPWLAWASSDLRPLLELHPGHMACRVLRLRRHPYTAIARVDHRSTRGTENVVLEFHGRLASFAGNTANRALARQAIAALRDRGCPLSPRAAALLAEPG
ncbi:hypothetical protein ACFFMP_03750 [Pseudoroseomonas cervicalis]|uniref:Uncharacterized protein n=1 Tax=Pseudoroseomonas cervicalis ATCC 49957 TaxID=525371 RepID=D5RPK9_9PROT|nr:hypothetical protein [Pseudoroseomonas cervicalis]EFH10756.1 hypothetical protein HMPREF0731_3020 [Pseudoroseomonas cervicalis ATCC 49957]